jgi:prefoldin subunit 5
MEDAIQTARELATHASDIAHLQSDMDKMAADIDEIKRMLTSINTTLAEAKGGWKMLLAVGGVAGAIGAGIMQVLHWWNK